MINITFPDGAVREYQAGVTTFEIAESISKSLATKRLLLGKFNGKLIDTTRAIEEEGTLEIVTPDHEDALASWSDSSSHFVCPGVSRVFSLEIKLGVASRLFRMVLRSYGQCGWSDFGMMNLPRIQEEMMKIVKENFPFRTS